MNHPDAEVTVHLQPESLLSEALKRHSGVHDAMMRESLLCLIQPVIPQLQIGMTEKAMLTV